MFVIYRGFRGDLVPRQFPFGFSHFFSLI